jgi:hypothetical protein
MTLVDELAEFVAGHRPHGTLKVGSGSLTPNGYRLSVLCRRCGVIFERWITPREADEGLGVLARLN